MSSYSWGGTGSAPYTENILSGPQQFDLAVRCVAAMLLRWPSAHCLLVSSEGPERCVRAHCKGVAISLAEA